MIVASVRRPAAERLAALVAALIAAAVSSAAPAHASPSVRYGVHDDAWLLYGPGTLDSRLAELERLGVDIVRYTLRWDQIARQRPGSARDHQDPAYDWRNADLVLRGLRRHRIAALVTLVGTPSWANGGRSSNWAPTDARTFADFAHAAAARFPWVRAWTIWNEPNQPRWLLPLSTRIYVNRLLNPAYAEIHATIRDVEVGGGVTSPRAGLGISPVAWIRSMGRLGARLDAYAHNPYPSQRQETPWTGGCGHCSTISLADLERLLREVRRNLGRKRIWLTEHGYQTNPPDPILGVSRATQARYVASAARRAYLAPYVDILIHFLVRDDSSPDGWQSGLVAEDGTVKPSYTAFQLPFEQVSRKAARVTLWGQVRPRSGVQPYRLRAYRNGRWSWVGGVRGTDERGFFSITIAANRGTVLELYSLRDRRSSLPVHVR